MNEFDILNIEYFESSKKLDKKILDQNTKLIIVPSNIDNDRLRIFPFIVLSISIALP